MDREFFFHYSGNWIMFLEHFRTKLYLKPKNLISWKSYDWSNPLQHFHLFLGCLIMLLLIWKCCYMKCMTSSLILFSIIWSMSHVRIYNMFINIFPFSVTMELNKGFRIREFRIFPLSFLQAFFCAGLSIIFQIIEVLCLT